MTKVRMWENAEKAGMSLEGHAGKQVVCAACSMLSESLVNTLYVQGVKVTHKAEPGRLTVEYEREGRTHRSLNADGAYRMAKVGLEMLAQAYPEEVKIEQ